MSKSGLTSGDYRFVKQEIKSNGFHDNSFFDGNLPYLRTSSHSDLFSTMENSEDCNLAPVDWTKMVESDHSNSTALISQTSDSATTKDHNVWPFVFDHHFKQGFHDNQFPSDGKESQLTLPFNSGFDSQTIVSSNTDMYPTHLNPYQSSTDLLPSNELYSSSNNNYSSVQNILYTPPDPQAALETIHYLGRNTFSESFYEKLMNENGTHREQDLNPNININCMGNIHLQEQLLSSKTIADSHSMNERASHWSCDPSQLVPMNHKITMKTPTKRGKTSGIEPVINRRKTVQHSIRCTSCNLDLGIAFIRGSYFADADTSPVHALCGQCQLLDENVQPIKETELGKRKRREIKTIDCEVCHCRIGNGGLSSKLVSSDIKVEFVCTNCGIKYMFCSECGGGGKQRTGKWRPKELFEQGRRTCSLPHIRVGTAELHYKVVRAQDLTAEVLQGIQDVFFDCLLSLYCVPSIMVGAKYNSFNTVKAEIERLWQTSVIDVLFNNVLEGNKYITVAWIHKRHRNKGVGRSNPGKEMTPWLQRLGLQGIIPPPKFSADTDEKHHCFVAFSIAEWDQRLKTIFLAQMAPRSVFLKTMEGYMDLIRNCIEAIQNDAHAAGVPSPVHIWCWANADHSRLQSIPSRLKFIPKADYLSLYPALNPAALERYDYSPLNSVGTHVFAAAVKGFLNPHK
ncbi:hypothetical protein BC833DRAFT_620491 [Globomyces pollinis-pini]|nr:hypothetical protein BC833DRAFT_620491 [Globomyces pollinis-pini]